jgi:hypothetical protein
MDIVQIFEDQVTGASRSCLVIGGSVLMIERGNSNFACQTLVWVILISTDSGLLPPLAVTADGLAPLLPTNLIRPFVSPRILSPFYIVSFHLYQSLQPMIPNMVGNLVRMH